MLLCSCLAALAFTSCLSDDDSNSDNVLTQEQKAKCYQTVKGNYAGYLIRSKKGEYNTYVADTLNARWSITNDSTLIIADFPAYALAEHITDTTLRKALAAADAQSITCRIGFYKASSIQFLVNPLAPTYNLNYGDKNHKVQVAFYGNNYNCIGYYDQSTGLLQVQLIEAAIYVDDKQTTVLPTGIPFLLIGKKE